MSPYEITLLLRRHIIAVIAVLILAVAATYYVRHAPTTYVDAGTIIFAAPSSSAHPNPFSAASNTLVETGGVVALRIMGTQGEREVRAAGGTAAFSATLANLYNLEYPDYGEPDVLVSATSTNEAQAQQTFAVVVRLLGSTLTKWQAQDGVAPRNQITTRLVGSTGSLAQGGSSKRVVGGLAVLTFVLALSVANFLDRHPVRLARRLRAQVADMAGK